MIYVNTGNEATFQALYKPSHANSKEEKPGQAILGSSGGVFCEVDYLPLVWAVEIYSPFICTKKANGKWKIAKHNAITNEGQRDNITQNFSIKTLF